MHMKMWLRMLGVMLMVMATNVCADEAPLRPRVVGWVPAYGVDAAMEAMQADPQIAQALTHIGLQFWNPSPDGRSVVLAPASRDGRLIDEAAIARVREFAHARGIKVLLTVYNNSETTLTWDWDLARRAFKGKRRAFARALVATMLKHQLDGIDLDLEGEGGFDVDREAYARFVHTLAKAVHGHGTELTIDSFHSPCWNAPNMAWWSDWLGYVDAIHSMGYADLYEASEEAFTAEGQTPCMGGAKLFKYSWQLGWGLDAGYRVDQIVLGQPTWVDRWGASGRETDAISHIREVQGFGGGIALWDLQLPAPGWRQADTWRAVLDLGDHPGEGWKSLSRIGANADAH
ncbi:MAG TPA: glycosyl hydrolase family 18 protein [Chiayiivirga sp.]|nr:glycosyl hydrolase family 18 protein [Chiayiivirga sp.]